MSGDDQVPAGCGHVIDVTAISWERIHLTIRVRLSPAPDATQTAVPSAVSFEFIDAARAFPVPAVDAGGGVFDIRVNVTTFADRRAVPDGTWRLRARLDRVAGPA
ncbi:MAG: hypothetical protein QM602_09980, partial [Microbacterium sp.]